MISTTFLSGQGLGNQLWVYAACRAIAKSHNVPYLINQTQNFKGSGFLDIQYRSDELFQYSDGYSRLRQPRIFHESLYYDPELNYFASSYDSRVEQIDCDVELTGLFQSEKYLYNLTADLRDWIVLHPKFLSVVESFRDVCVLNLRGGEYKRHKNLILPKKYWIDAIANIRKNVGIDRFVIVTDDPRYASSFLPGIPILRGGIAECYAALHVAASIVVSNSSFSYFPIKTRADLPFVIAPMFWSRFANPYSRWASPANIYSNWLWQDQQGDLNSYEACYLHACSTHQYYLDRCTICAPQSALQKAPIFSFLRPDLRRYVKRFLSFLCPRLIG